MSNPYELRLQLFQEAKDYLVSVFDRDVMEWDRLNQQNLDLDTKYCNQLNRYEELKESGKIKDVEKEYPKPFQTKELPEYPQYPSREAILEMATFIRSFISEKGEE